MYQHSTPHHEGGHKPTQHAPPGGEARTSTEPTPARQTPQTTNTRQRRPHGGGDNSEPTKPAGHRAGYNTTNRHPNTLTQHSPPRGGPGTNTAPIPAKPTTQPRPQPTQQLATTQTKHHHRGRWPPTQHAQARGGPHTNIARPTKGGGTHKHGTPQQGRGQAPAQHQPRQVKHH